MKERVKGGLCIYVISNKILCAGQIAFGGLKKRYRQELWFNFSGENPSFFIFKQHRSSVRFRLDFYCVPGTQGINKS